MSNIPQNLRAEVIQRAGNRCEYCLLSQLGQEATFHIDHAIPVVAGGPTTLDNLALACVSCSLRKGSKQNAPDGAAGAETPLFNPRKHVWTEHFRWDREHVVPLTPIGRATVAALAMNRPLILAIRQEQATRARHP